MAIRNMLTGVLNPLKGWPDTNALDIAAPYSAAALAALAPDPIPGGRCAHLNASKQLDLGCEHEVGKIHMPIFTLHWSDHPDVVNVGGITGSASDDPQGWMGVKRGNMSGIVATAGVELQTDQFNTAQNYAPGDPLQAANINKGVLSKGALSSQLIVGIVSRGVVGLTQLPTATQVLTFWPVVIPPQ